MVSTEAAGNDRQPFDSIPPIHPPTRMTKAKNKSEAAGRLPFPTLPYANLRYAICRGRTVSIPDLFVDEERVDEVRRSDHIFPHHGPHRLALAVSSGSRALGDPRLTEQRRQAREKAQRTARPRRVHVDKKQRQQRKGEAAQPGGWVGGWVGVCTRDSKTSSWMHTNTDGRLDTKCCDTTGRHTRVIMHVPIESCVHTHAREARTTHHGTLLVARITIVCQIVQLL